MNIAILGAGSIACSMATAVAGIKDQGVNAYAVASRSLEKAQAFADKWGFEKAYGSYEELVADPKVDLVYVATPHTFHYEQAMLCVEHGKAALVEKPFTVNKQQAEKIFALAEEKKVLATEAIWSRYLPAVSIIRETMESGIIGDITTIEADFYSDLRHVPRLVEPDLAGGALLDLGVYDLTFASIFFGNDIVKVESTCEKYKTGVDARDEIIYTYRDGKKAILRTTLLENGRQGAYIIGSKGKIDITTITNYTRIHVYDNEGNLIKECQIPKQVNGYEYEVLACKRVLEQGGVECEEIPHAMTLTIMGEMDALRKEWGIRYPFE